MEETKQKFKYSRNEKILRAITFLGIALSMVVGILLLVLGKTANGIITLSACAVASFFVSTFVIKKVKTYFRDSKKRRAIYAIFYAFILIIAMLTAAFCSYFSSYDYKELMPEAISCAEKAAKKDYPNSEILETDVFEVLESSDSYYYAIEIRIQAMDAEKCPNYYYQINKYTGRIVALSSDDYTIATAALY